MKWTLTALIACGAAFLCTGPAAQAVKPIVLVSPVSAGSGADNLARILASGFATATGQTVVVENKPGAQGAIAAQYVASGPAEGQRLLLGGGGMFALPLVMTPAPFAVVDLVPVSSVGRPAYGLFVHPGVVAQSFREFVDYARSHPGQLNYGSVNLSTDLAAIQLAAAVGIEIVRVPYKGGGQAMSDLLAGRVQVFFGPLANGLSHVRDGRLRLLATHPAPSAEARGTPTLVQAGAAIRFEPMQYLVLVPAKTPRDIVERLSRGVNVALRDPDVRTRLEKQAVLVEGSSPEAAQSAVQDAVRVWTRFVAENGLAR